MYLQSRPLLVDFGRKRLQGLKNHVNQHISRDQLYSYSQRLADRFYLTYVSPNTAATLLQGWSLSDFRITVALD